MNAVTDIAMNNTSDDVLFEIRGRAGFITLNRPKVLNALTHAMIRAIRVQLEDWERDDHVSHVVIQAAGERAFCAGGDIRDIYEQGCVTGEPGNLGQLALFVDEYRLNAYIKHYPKPYIALIDGIVMGGGVGLSVHGRYRVGGQRTTFAMPEVGIGFFPDVGGAYFLPRMPEETGMYCALTGGRLKQADALWSGVLTHAVSSQKLGELAAALEEADDVGAVLAQFQEDPDPAPLAALSQTIARIFSASDVAAILSALDSETGEHAEWAEKTATTIRRQSPMSVEIAFRQLRRGAELDFDAAMQLEYRIVAHVLKGHDFYEGVRAAIIDKDGTPKWQPSGLDDINSVDVEVYFMQPQTGDLDLIA